MTNLSEFRRIGISNEAANFDLTLQKTNVRKSKTRFLYTYLSGSHEELQYRELRMKHVSIGGGALSSSPSASATSAHIRDKSASCFRAVKSTKQQ
jgi:hypothetical protein